MLEVIVIRKLNGQCIMFVFVMKPFKFLQLHAFWAMKITCCIVMNKARNQNATWMSSTKNKELLNIE